MNNSSIKKNGLYNALKTFSSVLFPLITVPYVLRTLLPDNYGKITFGASVVSYFSLIASLGINTYAIRECAAVRNDKKKLGDIAGQLLSINIITTVLAYVLLIITLVVYPKLSNYRLLILLQSASIIATTFGADWLNTAVEDFKYITIRTFAFQILSILLMFIFIHKPEDYLKYVVIHFVSSSGANITNIWYRRKYCSTRLTFNIEWKRHIKPILFLFVMILAQNIYSNIDSTMLGLMISDREVGIYGTAHRIMALIVQLVVSLVWVVLPRLSLFFSQKDYDLANSLINKVFAFFSLFGLPLTIGVIILSREIVEIVAGPNYSDSAIVLQILMIGFVFYLYGGAFIGNIILLPTKREKEYMIICCVTAVFNAITNYLIIPLYGARAAAFTTVLSNLFMLILLLFSINKSVKLINWRKSITAPLIGCVSICLVCLLCKHFDNLWIRTITSIGVSIPTYFLVQLLLKNEYFISIVETVCKKFSAS